MIVEKTEVEPGVWSCMLDTGIIMTIVCGEGQTPEEVLAEAEG